MCLLGYGFAVAVLGPDVLARVAPGGYAPRFGITIWVATIASVLAAWTAAAALVTTEIVLARGDLGRVLVECVGVLRAAATGEHGRAVQAGLATLGAVVVAALAAWVVRAGRTLARFRRHTHRHADTARLVGRRSHDRDVVILDVPQRLVYAVAGRPPVIVVSSAALNALDGEQLAAVLAHERAHLAGRHHVLVAFTRGLATAMPRVRLFVTGADQAAWLVELCADDAATRRHGRGRLVDALLALTAAAPLPTGALPNDALAATGSGVIDRIERLVTPPDPGRVRAARLRLSLGMVALLSGPATLAFLALAQPGLCDTLLF